MINFKLRFQNFPNATSHKVCRKSYNPLILLCLAFCAPANAQQIDTVIHAPCYTSYYCYALHDPIAVSYTLYHGGGDCSRSGDRFSTDDLPSSATQADYAHSGYDQGHLADSKDFAYDCDLQESTFRFYNCLPQTPHLNRGIWKHFETEVRKMSQTDSLSVWCGGKFTGSKTIGSGVAVPDSCWKIVQSIKSGKILLSLMFANDATGYYREMGLSEAFFDKWRNMIKRP